MKKLFLCFAFLMAVITCWAQVQSPDLFLGYRIGSRYTPHFQVVNYFKHLALQAPNMVKLQQYGSTNEGRPLYLAFISTADNISNLENIRLNNMRLANLAKDKVAPTEVSQAIVWLSYNVHGNETSSSEAAMLTAFALTDPNNNQTKNWLKNTVVIIDPCLNPDGRDRYVNWFNGMVGNQYDPYVNAREHREPWPGGRTNHYNFDLNRDWAWQTQVESRQRSVQYLQWMPQIHVDFHEQGVNQPYYFAPAAQPYHESVTNWQRDFQVTIGKNHAGYFDKNNWLYFTKETFDLFYPSYGDTYPIYNGSIGMTYEQGGGPQGGLGIHTNDGDTLTLFDRALHHHTTGLSTIEVASANAGKLLKEFKKFFSDANAGNVGTYKTYVVKNNPADEGKVRALLQLLDKNGIEYGTASGTGKGYNYHNRKEENFSISANDIVVSVAQPRGVLVNVLFEPSSKLVDSATYDITAWALPYVYGLNAYASTQRVNVSPKNAAITSGNPTADAYGYVIRWEATNSAATLAKLLQKGIKLRMSETAFESNNESFGSGSIIILKRGNEHFGTDLWKEVAAICNTNHTTMYAVKSGMVDKGFDFGSYYVRTIKAPRVALLTGENVNSNAAGEVWNFFDNELKYKITLINANDFDRINWSDFDVIIMPDGRYRFLSDKTSSDKLENWISAGGRVVAMESAVGQLSKLEWSNLKSKGGNDEDSNSNSNKDPYESLRSYSDRERAGIAQFTPGAIFKVDVDNSHPLMFGYPKYYYTLKMDNAVYEFIKEGGWNAGVIKKENQLAGFVGHKLSPKLKDGLLFGVQDIGNGAVVYLSDNVLFRNFWENGKLMFSNAVFMVGQ